VAPGTLVLGHGVPLRPRAPVASWDHPPSHRLPEPDAQSLAPVRRAGVRLMGWTPPPTGGGTTRVGPSAARAPRGAPPLTLGDPRRPWPGGGTRPRVPRQQPALRRGYHDACARLAPVALGALPPDPQRVAWPESAATSLRSAASACPRPVGTAAPTRRATPRATQRGRPRGTAAAGVP
jgi:hypothetical protein